MKIHVTQTGAVRIAIQARTHAIVGDQPAENGGEDSGMASPELLLASPGSSAARSRTRRGAQAMAGGKSLPGR